MRLIYALIIDGKVGTRSNKREAIRAAKVLGGLEVRAMPLKVFRIGQMNNAWNADHFRTMSFPVPY